METRQQWGRICRFTTSCDVYCMHAADDEAVYRQILTHGERRVLHALAISRANRQHLAPSALMKYRAAKTGFLSIANERYVTERSGTRRLEASRTSDVGNEVTTHIDCAASRTGCVYCDYVMRRANKSATTTRRKSRQNGRLQMTFALYVFRPIPTFTPVRCPTPNSPSLLTRKNLVILIYG